MIEDVLLIDVPFAADAEKAYANAYDLLPYRRLLIDGPTPVHAFGSPSPGSGKSRFLDTLTAIATGRAASTVTEGEYDEEWRNKITSMAHAGAQIFSIDNMKEFT